MTNRIILEGERAAVSSYSCSLGIHHRVVRRFRVCECRPYAQYDVGHSVDFCMPRERRWYGMWVYPNNVCYVIIEHNGTVLYDSRT